MRICRPDPFLTLFLILSSLIISCNDDSYTVRSELIGTWIDEFDNGYTFMDDGKYVNTSGGTAEWSATETQLKIREELEGVFEQSDITYGIDGNKLLRECFVRTNGSGNNGSWTQKINIISSDDKGNSYTSTSTRTIKIDGETFHLSERWTEQESKDKKEEDSREGTGKITWSENEFTVTDFPKNPNEPIITGDPTTETVRGCYWKEKNIIVWNIAIHASCDEQVLEKQ